MAKLRLTMGGQIWSIEVGAQQVLLDYALTNGIPVSYSCKRGDCQQCIATLRSGHVTACDICRPLFLDNKILLCNAVVDGDLEVELPHIQELDGIQVLRTACKIHAVTRLSVDVIEVSFRLPPAIRFNFVPGQFIRVTNKSRIARSYSIVTSCDNVKAVSVHVRRIDGGVFSDYLFETAKPGDLLHLEGPMGQFFLRRDVSVGKSVFLATGTGIAPVYAILSSMNAEQRNRCGDLFLYWGNQRRSDAYLSERLLTLTQRLGMQYCEVYSRENAQAGNRVRYVQDLMMQSHSHLADAQVFASGNPEMVDDGRKQAVAMKLPVDRFFADPFTAS